MKSLILILLLIMPAYGIAQPIPHNMVYGTQPRTAGLVYADKLEAFMGKRPRISVTISGLVTLVTKSKGGWFDIDAGHGNIITAHFKNYGINIPANLKGRYIIAEGVAEKKFIADDKQHFAGGNDGNTHHMPKQSIIFEVKGLKVVK
jgi:hypothetical protein